MTPYFIFNRAEVTFKFLGHFPDFHAACAHLEAHPIIGTSQRQISLCELNNVYKIIAEAKQALDNIPLDI